MRAQTRLLNRGLPVPLYYQLKSLILDQIRRGELKPDDRIPSEDEIAVSYGVSKATVRQALSELADANVLRRVQGLGTFVAHPRLAQGPRELTSFTQEMYKQNLHPSSRVLIKDLIGAEGEVAEKLQLAEGTTVFRLKRLRLADGEPLGIQTVFISIALAPDLPNNDFATQSLYETLERKYALVPARAEEVHFAVLVKPEDAVLLEVPAGAPALGAERVTYLSSGQPLEFVNSLMRADRYQIRLHLVNTKAMPFNLEK